VSRASEDLLAALHGLVGENIKQLLLSDDPRDIRDGISLGLKFLKDNNITATLDASTPLADIQAALPSAEELERLMTLTPD
jgi:hypothetical protein